MLNEIGVVIVRQLGLGRWLFTGFAVLIAGGLVYSFASDDNATSLNSANAAQEQSDKPSAPKTQTGLPLPRFVSLKSERVNVRRGPSNQHGVIWVFTKSKLPVEIVAEYDHWRRIRDSEGAEGWVYHSLLSGRRTVIAAPWAKGTNIALRASASKDAGLVAQVSSGAVGDLQSCDGRWCATNFGSYEGYVLQEKLFGIYPSETYDK